MSRFIVPLGFFLALAVSIVVWWNLPALGALGVLMRGYANYRGRGGEIKLCGLGKRIKDLFTMTKLIMVFDHHETEDEAIAAFAA